MSEQQLSVALRAREAVSSLLLVRLNGTGLTQWLNQQENAAFLIYQDFTDEQLRTERSQLSTEIHDLRAQGKFNHSIIYYFLILIYSSSFFHILFL